MTDRYRQRCLVVGGRGFVGSALAAEARDRGFDASIIGSDDYASAVGRSFDMVLFAAGNARRYLAERDPARDFDASVALVARAVRDFPARHFVLVSTVDVYPDATGDTREGSDIDPTRLSIYGFHKRLAELVVMRHAPSWLIVRLGQMVGPGLLKGPLFDALRGEPLWVSPASEYPFLHTAHAAALTFDLHMGGARDAIFNVCGEGSVALGRVLSLMGRVAETREGARVERYSIDVSALAERHAVPRSWDDVRAFVEPPA